MNDKLDQIIEHMADCIGESKNERRDDTSQIFTEAKAAIIILMAERERLAKTDLLKTLKWVANHGTWLGWQIAPGQYITGADFPVTVEAAVEGMLKQLDSSKTEEKI